MNYQEAEILHIANARHTDIRKVWYQDIFVLSSFSRDKIYYKQAILSHVWHVWTVGII